jgi:predicted branched-subunit amino acid permease
LHPQTTGHILRYAIFVWRIEWVSGDGRLVRGPPHRAEYWAGVRAVAPLAAVIGVLGVLLGYASTSAGLTPTAAVVMSATTFSGSPQLASLSILRQGGTVVSATAAGALVAARYLAMGATLAPSLDGSRWKRALVAQLAVDESWAVAYRGDGHFSRARLVGAGLLVYAVHVATTAVGALAGAVVGDPSAWGLDAAFPALFVLLLWPTLDRRDARVTAALAAAIALALTPIAPAGVPILAAGAAAFVGVGRPA